MSTREKNTVRARVAVVVAVCAVVAAITLQAVSATTPISSNPSGATFTAVTPNSGLGNETLSYTVGAPGGLLNVTTHLCAWTTTPYSDATFNVGTGTKCVNGANIYEGGLGGMGVNDYETIKPFTGSETSSGALSFKVGTGNVKWTADNGQLGLAGAGLTCDATNSCALVSKVDVTGVANPVYLSQQLCFGADTTCTTGPTTTSSSTTSSTSSTSTSSSSTSSTSTSSTSTSSTSSTSTSTSTSTTAPSTTTTTTAPAGGTVTPSQTAPGGSVNVSSDGWKASSPVTVTLNSTPVSLGTITTTAAGVAQGQFTIPPTTEVGSHTIVLAGNNPADAAKTVTLPLTVTAQAPVDTTVTTTGFATSAPLPTGTAGTGTGSLPFSGSNTRDLASIGLLLLAAGMLLLGQHYRHRSAS